MELKSFFRVSFSNILEQFQKMTTVSESSIAIDRAIGQLQTPGLVATNIVLFGIWLVVYSVMFYKYYNSKSRTYAQKLGLFLIVFLN